MATEAEFVGQKSKELSSLLFTVTSTNEFTPPSFEQKWFETGL